MSNQLAIAAVTRTIQSMLEGSGISTKTLTPDRAGREQGTFINLFLYHTMHNATWRNQDIPGRVSKSERGNPPLALSLYYLLTAYGDDGPNLSDQQLLGSAMRVLHDRPILKSKYVSDALTNYQELATSELADQIDKVRIVPEHLDIENMSRLWTTFQTQYRVSAAYQASVVLIESKRPTPSSLPVTKRGENDNGVLSNLGLEPAIYSIEYRSDSSEPEMSAAEVGTVISIRGDNLPLQNTTIVIRDPRASDDGDADILAKLPPLPGSSAQLMKVKLDESIGTWRAGLVSLELEMAIGDRTLSSNSIPLAIAPKVLTSGGDMSVVASVDEAAGKRLLSVSLANPTGDTKKVFLTLNLDAKTKSDNAFYQIPAGSNLGSVLMPVFDITKVPSGNYWVRVRVEGVDSLLVRKKVDPKTGQVQVDFDPEQRIHI